MGGSGWLKLYFSQPISGVIQSGICYLPNCTFKARDYRNATFGIFPQNPPYIGDKSLPITIGTGEVAQWWSRGLISPWM
jgi:hypothetical protein